MREAGADEGGFIRRGSFAGDPAAIAFGKLDDFVPAIGDGEAGLRLMPHERTGCGVGREMQPFAGAGQHEVALIEGEKFGDPSGQRGGFGDGEVAGLAQEIRGVGKGSGK